jgi:hypothetical protein
MVPEIIGRKAAIRDEGSRPNDQDRRRDAAGRGARISERKSDAGRKAGRPRRRPGKTRARARRMRGGGSAQESPAAQPRRKRRPQLRRNAAERRGQPGGSRRRPQRRRVQGGRASRGRRWLTSGDCQRRTMASKAAVSPARTRAMMALSAASSVEGAPGCWGAVITLLSAGRTSNHGARFHFLCRAISRTILKPLRARGGRTG